MVRDKALGLAAKGLPMPLSIFALDAWGCDVPEAGLAFGTGDPDGLCWPVAGRWSKAPWLGEDSAQVFLEMVGRDEGPDGTPAQADPRGVLKAVLARYAARGLTPVVATELEFYLYRLDQGLPVPPDGNMARNDTLSTSALTAHVALFDQIMEVAHAMGIPADAVVSEAGPGQYELNLLHRADALAAADDTVLMKRIVRALAAAQGLGATFMAKPYGDCSGSGMHIHASLLDASGANVLARPEGGPSDALFHAVAGLLAAMPETMLAFAPNYNSFRRFRPDAHAPTSAGWGIDDRSAAIRVIAGDAKATRIEHRISGADVNPYIAMAAMLGAMMQGIEEGAMPPPRKIRCSRAPGPRCRSNGARRWLPLPPRSARRKCSARGSARSIWPASSRTARCSCARSTASNTILIWGCCNGACSGPRLCRNADMVCGERRSGPGAPGSRRRAQGQRLRGRGGVHRDVGGARTGGQGL
jgi:glutamine synthetase